MERESFESDDVAQLLNSSFISIKVDREQRPDIDQVYMEVCQALTGSGGWPLTIIMTPDKKPVFAGTYFPRRQKYGRPGLMEILAKVAALWQTSPATLFNSAKEISDAFKTRKDFQPGPVKEELFFRPENIYDGAMPSARSIYADAVLTLYQITGQSKYLQKVENILAANSELISEAPWVSVSLLKVLLRFFAEQSRLVIGSKDKEYAFEAVEMLDDFEPFDSTVILIKNNDDGKLAADLSDNELQLPDTERQQLQLCVGDTCLKPAKNIEDFKAVLHSLKK
jgi:uncharacterized protein YyaL (SSP411 family)